MVLVTTRTCLVGCACRARAVWRARGVEGRACHLHTEGRAAQRHVPNMTKQAPTPPRHPSERRRGAQDRPPGRERESSTPPEGGGAAEDRTDTHKSKHNVNEPTKKTKPQRQHFFGARDLEIHKADDLRVRRIPNQDRGNPPPTHPPNPPAATTPHFRFAGIGKPSKRSVVSEWFW